MFFKKRKNKNKGFMMVEIVIAISVISVFSLIALNVAQKSIVVSNRSVHTTQAAYLLEEGVESVRIFRDNNTWTNFLNLFNSSYTYCLPEEVASWTSSLSTTLPCSKIGIFTRTINVEDVNRDTSSGDIVSSGGSFDNGTKLFTITVSWQEGGNTLNKVLKFYINDLFS